MTDDGYRQLMKHAKRLAQEGHGELAQHLRDAIDLRAEVEALKLERTAAELVHRETATTVLMQMAEVQRLRDALTAICAVADDREEGNYDTVPIHFIRSIARDATKGGK